MELFTASNQWMNRPADERFWGLDDMYEAVRKIREASLESTPMGWNDLSFQNIKDNLALVTPKGNPLRLTNYAFGQAARLCDFSSTQLRKLNPETACLVLNEMREKTADRHNSGAVALFHEQDGARFARALTSEHYDRVWNAELIEAMRPLVTSHGWRVPPARPAFEDPRTRPATAEDILPNQGDFGLSIREGDPIAPAGCYASDHDMFVFLVDPNQGPVVPDGSRQLMRGMFVRNSEVGDGSLRVSLFCMDNVCGNHIVWGASSLQTIRVKHVGVETLDKAVSKLEVFLKEYDESGALSEWEAKLKKAARFEIAAKKEDVLEAVFRYASKYRLNSIGKRLINHAVSRAEQRTDRYGNPYTPFAVMSGITELSQESGYADKRTEIDRQAGRILDMAG